jgi:hypothetical protein
MNTLAQAEVRRNRLKNNTTRLSPAPDQAICNCWHKRKLAGYPTVGDNRPIEQPEASLRIDFRYFQNDSMSRPAFAD